MSAVDEPPLYAAHIAGELSATIHSAITDTESRPLHKDGSVIEGLYVCGNDQGGFYPHNYPSNFTGINAGRTATFALTVPFASPSAPPAKNPKGARPLRAVLLHARGIIPRLAWPKTRGGACIGRPRHLRKTTVAPRAPRNGSPARPMRSRAPHLVATPLRYGILHQRAAHAAVRGAPGRYFISCVTACA